MALSIEEKEALLELKTKGYSFSEAMGFIGSSRLGNTSKVERDFSQSETAPVDTSVGADLKAGFQGAKDALQQGMDRELNIESQNRSKPSELFGKFASGLRTAGSAIGSVATGAIRALPGGTATVNKIEDIAEKGVEKVATSEFGKGTAETYRSLPQGVKNFAGDVGNIAMGAAELSGVLTVPGATNALVSGLKTFSQAGIKEVGSAGIKTSIKTGLSPDDLMQRVARVSKTKQAQFEERAGESIGSYLVNRDIFGDPEAITDQLYDRMKASKARVDAGLAKVGGTYKNGSVEDALNQLAEREARVSSPNTPSRDQARVSSLLTKHNKSGLTLEEVNEVKRLYERNVKLDYLRDNVADGVAKANNIDDKLREFVVKKADQGGFKDVTALNRETFLAKQLLDDLGAEYAGQTGNNFVSLSDAIFLAEAASNPTALAAFGLKKTFSSKSTMSGVAKILANKRAKQGLPEGNVTGALRLPPGQPGSGSTVFGGKTMELPADNARLKGVIETGQENVKQPSSSNVTESPIKKVQNVETDALESVRAQLLDVSDTGTANTMDGGFIRTTSFPSWIPQDSGLRSKELFRKVLEHIDNGTVPKESAGRQLELYSLVKSQIETVKFNKFAEAENWTKADGSPMTIDDIPFSLLLATGAALGAYYIYGDEELVPMIGIIGMVAMTPGNKLKLINRQIDKLAKAEETLLRDGAKRSDSNVKSILEARTKLERERRELPDFNQGEIPTLKGTPDPTLKTKREVVGKTVNGEKFTVPAGTVIKPMVDGSKTTITVEGKQYIIPKNQYDNLKGQSDIAVAIKFAPELEGTIETVKGARKTGQTKASVRSELEAKGIFVEKDMSGEANLVDKNGDLIEYDDLSPAQKKKVDYVIGDSETYDDIAEASTKYSQYTLDGGENYREILIQAPTENAVFNTKTNSWNVVDENGKAIKSSSPNYKSSHWDEPNVISHLRMNERTVDGKKYAFMEELQSDWARDARKDGVADGENPYKVVKNGNFYEVRFNDEFVVKSDVKELMENEAKRRWEDRLMRTGDTRSPNHPLLKNWQIPTVKRALMEAVDSGAERFAWINGEQTSARYNLATHVEEVKWGKRTTGGKPVTSIDIIPQSGGKNVSVDVDNTGTIVDSVQQSDWKGKKLDEVLGKGLADKIMEKETGTLSGDGLSFGGEWASNLYDRQVRDIVKKLTGAEVKTVDLKLGVGKNEPIMLLNTKTGRTFNDKLATEKDLKVGQAIYQTKSSGSGDYIITNVLGNGKFKAIPKKKYDDIMNVDLKEITLPSGNKGYEYMGADGKKVRTNSLENAQKALNYQIEDIIPEIVETFDISNPTAVQQYIDLTPEVKARIRSEAPKFNMKDGMNVAMPLLLAYFYAEAK